MFFSRALRDCPVACRTDLSRVLFYLGIALKKLGFSNSAVRSWITAQRTKKRKQTRDLLSRFSNSYGMAKQGTAALDDWQAFYSVQLMRYLRGFNKRTLTSQSERCMLSEIISVYWRKLQSSGILTGKSPAEKRDIFEATRIDFPLFFHGPAKDPVLRVDFRTGQKLRPGDKCLCGSGLPFLACCGRTPGEDELTIGIF